MKYDRNWDYNLVLCSFNIDDIFENNNFDILNKEYIFKQNDIDIDKGNKKYGYSSLFLKNNNSQIISNGYKPVTSTDYITLEFFILFKQTTNGSFIKIKSFDKDYNTCIFNFSLDNNQFILKLKNNNGQFDLLKIDYDINLNSWYHFALCLNKDTVKFFINGIEIKKELFDFEKENPKEVFTNVWRITFGKDDDLKLNSIIGNIDSFRLTNCERYNGNFAPSEFLSSKLVIDEKASVKSNILQMIQYTNFSFNKITEDMFFIKNYGIDNHKKFFMILEGIVDKGLKGEWLIYYDRFDLSKLNENGIFYNKLNKDSTDKLFLNEIVSNNGNTINGLTLQEDDDDKIKNDLFDILRIHKLNIKKIEDNQLEDYTCFLIYPQDELKVIYSNSIKIYISNKKR